jgi:4'-phosphopantetheinyl transferase
LVVGLKGGIDLLIVRIRSVDALITQQEFALLDLEELARCKALRLDADRRRFIVARTLIRQVLDEAAGRGNWRVFKDEKGRLFAELSNSSYIDLNLSHAGQYVAIAVSREGRVGVDLEPLSSFDNIGDALKLYMTPNEQAAMLAAVPSQRQELVARAWVMKEAILKAEGCGLLKDPRNIHLAMDFDEAVWYRNGEFSIQWRYVDHAKIRILLGVAWRGPCGKGIGPEIKQQICNYPGTG